MSTVGQREGRSFGMRLAAGKQVGKIFQRKIYLRGVKRAEVGWSALDCHPPRNNGLQFCRRPSSSL
eukprot:4154122-Amphidinium_carterae.1